MPKKEKDFLIKLGERIHETRKSQDISQEVLAKRAGTTRLQIIRIENASQPTNIITLYRIAQELSIPLSDLVDIK